MRFRTEIEPPKASFAIDHAMPVLLLGSCFTDEIGRRLEIDGFTVLRNPFGPLYNPVSIARCVTDSLSGTVCTDADLVKGPRGYHCLDYSTRFSGDAFAVADDVNTTRREMAAFACNASLAIITLGSAFVFYTAKGNRPVGNCHKFPADFFVRRRLSVEEASDALADITRHLLAAGIGHVIFTVSPIRHLADGLHGNTLSKSTLQLAADAIAGRNPDTVTYFPSYEIMLDDLRDYRFYDADMKHPSPVAVDYIYQIFADTFFSRETKAEAADARKRYLAAQHRTILQS